MTGPAIANFPMYRGQAITMLFGPVKDLNDVTQDVSSWTAVFVMRGKDSDPDPVKLTKAATVVAPGSNGILQVALTSAETLTLAPGRYAYMLERSNVGAEDPLTTGIITVKRDVVHASPLS